MKIRLPLAVLLASVLIGAILLVRLIALGHVPLAPGEAVYALEAAEWADHGSSFWQGNSTMLAPGYYSMTSTLIVWFGAQNAIARLVPALFGAALAALPLALGRELSWPARLLASLLLAFSTASLTASRTAGGQTMAAFGLSLTALYLFKTSTNRTPQTQLIAGLGLGIALAAGSQLWQGLLGLGLAYLVSRIIRAPADEPTDAGEWNLGLLFHWRTALSALVAGVLLTTGFGVHIEGLAQALQAPGRWLLGWFDGDGIPLVTAMAVPIIYEPLLLIFGGYSANRALRGVARLPRLAALWALGSLLAYLIYPGRQPADLLWAIIPLSVLAAAEIERIADRILDLANPVSTLFLSIVLLIVFSFAYLMLENSIAGLGLASLEKEAQLAFALTAIAFAGMLILLFGVGWSWRETLLAVGSSMVLALGMAAFASSWAVNFTQEATRARELWRQQVSTRHLPLLEDTLADIAKWYVGRADNLAIQVQGQATPALAWGLRDHRQAASQDVGTAPPVILAPESAPARLPADYLGQAFAINESWGWQGALPPNYLVWLLDRRAPVEVERWILYVRTDVAELGATPALQETE